MKINEIFETVCRLINKTAQVAYKDFNLFFPMAERQLYDELIPPDVTGLNKIPTRLRPFAKLTQLTLNEDGECDVPKAFTKWESAQVAYYSGGEARDVKLIEPHLMGARHQSKLFGPTKQYPIAEMIDKKFIVYPRDKGALTLSYLREPIKSKWGFTLNANNRPVFSESLSVDTEFTGDCANELIVRTLAYFGVNMKAQDITQYGEVKQKEIL